VYSLLALNLVRKLCPAPEDPKRTHPWRDTVKRKVREELEKNKDTLLCGPMDEMRRKQLL
jgi:hypothetical protein